MSSSSIALFCACSLGVPTSSSGKQTFCSAERCMSRLKDWKIIPICWRSWRSCFWLSVVSSTPSMKIWPSVGCSSKLMQRTSVDFPAPDSPMMPKISPRRMDRLTFFSAVTSPPEPENIFVKFLISIMGACSMW